MGPVNIDPVGPCAATVTRGGRWARPGLGTAAKHSEVPHCDIFAIGVSRRLRHPETVLNSSTGHCDVLDNRVADSTAATHDIGGAIHRGAKSRGAAGGLKWCPSAQRVRIWIPRALNPNKMHIGDPTVTSEHKPNAIDVIQSAAVKVPPLLSSVRSHRHYRSAIADTAASGPHDLSAVWKLVLAVDEVGARRQLMDPTALLDRGNPTEAGVGRPGWGRQCGDQQ
mmetsp:Transcript_486/g.1578  ORF Transcript_486/g.1578 Transcript_486/m.1578 type:complete len:224 (+) Transcript_486:451-1122(+)